MVNECTSPYAHEKVAQALLRKGYLRKLLDVFRTTEDIEDADGLANAFKAVKGIVLLNDTNVFDLLLSEEVVMDVVRQRMAHWLGFAWGFEKVNGHTERSLIAKQII